VDIALVRYPESVVIVAVEGDQLVCVRQARPGSGGPTLELPSGKVEANESPGDAARRELAEECGLQASEWRELGRFWAVPAYSTEFVHAFVAADLSPVGGAKLDEDEEIELERVSLVGVLDRLSDACSLAAFALWLEAR
jgi:ADP-ribose pyrophosphatase